MAMDDNALSTILAVNTRHARFFFFGPDCRTIPPIARPITWPVVTLMRRAVARRLIHDRGNRAAIAINLTIMRHDDRGRPRYTCESGEYAGVCLARDNVSVCVRARLRLLNFAI